MAESLRLETNIPQIVALRFADGLEVESKYSGSQIMYTLTDDRRMFLPLIVADKIRAAGITAGEVFSICKREVKTGNRRTIEYQITTEPIETAAGLVAAVPTTTAAAITTPVKASAASLAEAPPPPAYSHASDGNAARAIHVMSAPAADSSAVALMKIALAGAIDAALDGERYAQSRGMIDFAFGAENIQKIAGCLFIELSRKVGRA